MPILDIDLSIPTAISSSEGQVGLLISQGALSFWIRHDRFQDLRYFVVTFRLRYASRRRETRFVPEGVVQGPPRFRRPI